MLQAFYRQFGAAAVTKAEEEQWLRGYFPAAAAISYDNDQEQEAAPDTAGGDVMDQDMQQEEAGAAIAAATAAAAAAAAADAAASAPAVLPATRRSGRQRGKPDPIFGADINRFAALALAGQPHQHRKHTVSTTAALAATAAAAAAAAQPNTPKQKTRPRSGRGL